MRGAENKDTSVTSLLSKLSREGVTLAHPEFLKEFVVKLLASAPPRLLVVEAYSKKRGLFREITLDSDDKFYGGRRRPKSDDLALTALNDFAPVRVENVPAAKNRPQSIEAASRSALCVPFRDRASGVVWFAADVPDAFPLSDDASYFAAATIIGEAVNRRIAERRLRRAKRRERDRELELRRVFEASESVTLAFRLNRRNEFVDYFAPDADQLAIPPSKFIGRRVEDAVGGQIAPRFRRVADEARKTGKPLTFNYRLPVGGKARAFSAKLYPEPNHSLLVLVRDFSSQTPKRADARADIERRVRFFDRSPVGKLIVDKHGMILHCNDAFAGLLGKNKGELEGDSVFEIVHEEDLSDFRDRFEALSNDTTTTQEFAHRLVRADQSFAPVTVNAFAEEGFENAEGDRAIVFHVVDVAQLKHANDQLEERETMLRAVAETSYQLVAGGGFEESLEEALETLGKTLGVSRIFLFAFDRRGGPRKIKIIDEWLDESFESVTSDYRGNEVFLSDQTYSLYRSGESIEAFTKDMPSEQREIFEHFGIKTFYAAPIFLDNELWGYIRFDDARAERSWSESERQFIETAVYLLGGAVALNEAREQTERTAHRYELLNDLMRHDVTNHNNSIYPLIELLLAREKVSDRIMEPLKVVARASREISRLIDNVGLINSVETGRYSYAVLDFPELLETARERLVADFPAKTVLLEHDFEKSEPVLFEGSDLFHHALDNLLKNAVKYNDKKEARVELRHTLIMNGDYWKIEIIDNARGVHKIDRPHLFSRLDARIKDMKLFKTGLGLSLTKALVESIDGWIELEDRAPGDYSQGSNFILYLKRATR
ncbi:MAG: GAF domain-containing protein [Ignavibacteriales bacterium]|nr:GAF domain-containing protein [Ignavibacteriales bacterium]